jgi:surface polysaccharide O-acyltransferase-like enzyme
MPHNCKYVCVNFEPLSKMKNMQNHNFTWANNLRAFATVAVLVLHISAPILSRYNNVPMAYWWFANILDGATRFCVPVFLMLTGALILPKSYKLASFFKKRLSRILLPFLFWSVVYISYFYFKLHPLNGKFNFEDFTAFALNKLKNGAAYHLWYVYTIIGIYLIFPFVQKWIINKPQNKLIYYLIFWLIAIAVSFPVVNKFWPKVDLFYFLGLFGYTLLGYFLTYQFKIKHPKLIAIALIIFGLAITILGSYLITSKAGVFKPSFYNYLTLNVIALSSGIFLLFQNFEIKSKTLNIIVAIISKYSFGIYLSHILIIKIINQNGITWTYINPFVAIPLITFASLLFALLITFLINKIPYGKYISG